MKKVVKSTLRVMQIIAGAFLYAVSTAFFANPHDLAPGGISGVSIILNRLFLLINKNWNVPVGIFVLLLNIPLMIAGLIKFGRDFLPGTVFGTILVSIFTYALEILRVHLLDIGQTWFVIENSVVSAIFGGVCMALGLGIVLRAGATTGGTDIIVKLLRLKYRHMHTGKMFLILDTIICFSSLPVVGFQIETVFKALMTMFVSSYIVDLVLYGTDEAKLVYIISDRSSQIAERLLKETKVGATYLDGIGAYTQERKEVLMCAVKKHLFPKLKDVVKQEDPKAFLIVTSANEVFGEGYKDQFKEDM